MANRTKRTRKKVEDFLEVLKENHGNVTAACQAVKIGRTAAYRWRDEDADFAEHWDEITDAVLDEMEIEARRRAVEGTDKPVFYKGDVCGYIREFSDTLLIFALKAGRPEKYRERYEVKNTGVSKIEVVYVEQESGEDDQA